MDVPSDVLDAHYLDANRILNAVSDTGAYVERRHLAIASCGLPVDALNFGFLKPPFDEVEAAAQEAREYFDARKLPFRLSHRVGAPGDRLAPLERAGWHAGPEPTPGMMLPLPASVPDVPPGLRVERVRTSQQLVPFRETAFACFGYPVQAAHIFLNERLFLTPGVDLYVGLLEDRVVATSLLIVTHGVAGIYFVATLESVRGRGYGTALTWAAIERGRALGCTLASLQASELGRPVYEAMGFAHVLDYAHLFPPAA